MKGKLRTSLVCLILAVGTALLYAPVLHFNYVGLDDQLYFDTHIRRGWSWAALHWCFATLRGFMWHPLTWVSHLLDFQFFGMNFGGHHATNVALHILNSVLLFMLLRRMTGALWRSAVVAALFAWHPLHVESVAWLSERKDVLSALFWMLTLWAYVCYAEESKQQRAKSDSSYRRGAIFYFLALLFFVLGLMAKPMLVTLPFVFLLLDWWPLNRYYSASKPLQTSLEKLSSKTKPPQKTPLPGKESRSVILPLLIEKIPFFFFTIVFSVVTMFAASSRASSLATIPLSLRLGNSIVTYFIYVAKTIWPENMVVLYPFEFRWPPLQMMATAIFLIVISVAAFLLRKSRPYLLLGWLWYLGILVPVIGLVQVGAQPMADRYTYIPSIGLFVIFCWGACDLLRSLPYAKVTLGALGCAALLPCLLVSSKQLQYWRNSDTLFTHNLEVAPNNYFAHAAYAGYFYNSRQLDRAIAESKKSIELKPDYAFAHTVLGESLLLQGKTDQAVAQFLLSLQLDPTALDARLSYGNALLAQDRPADAMQHINAVLSEAPDDPEAHFLRGQALLKEGDLAGAHSEFAIAMSLVKRYSEAQFQLAIVQARQGMIPESMENYRAAKEVPSSVPDFLVLNNLAWILAASSHPEWRDGARAVDLATRARDLDKSKQPAIIGTLADAYAEAGRFDNAVAAAQEAHDRALKAADEAHNPADQKAAKDLAARNLELLDLYRAHKVYHETLDFKQ
jgi:protein O-mannosyl-transferase